MENKKLVRKYNSSFLNDLINILKERFESVHDGKLTCAAVCAKQKKLLITGGGDNNVCVWLLNKSQPITVNNSCHYF